MRDLEGKTAVITGCASGMGRTFADGFARAGMSLVMADVFDRISQQPADVEDRVLAAILEERFWIETDEWYPEAIAARHRSIENQTAPPARGLILSPYLEAAEFASSGEQG